MLFPILGPSILPVVVAQPDERRANWTASVFEWNDKHRVYIDFLKTFQIALIGWIKAGLPKKPFLFWSWKKANSTTSGSNEVVVNLSIFLIFKSRKFLQSSNHCSYFNKLEKHTDKLCQAILQKNLQQFAYPTIKYLRFKPSHFKQFRTTASSTLGC